QTVYRAALITLNRRQREYDQATDLVTLQVRQAYRDLSEAAEQYNVLSDALKLAQKRFDNTYLLLQYGKASSRRVLAAQSDLFNAQNEAAQALVDYNIATLNFYRDTGALQVLPDGMWKL
ncbi:MAG: TolC family protein, partial [Sedimentisphaerales bacterium]